MELTCMVALCQGSLICDPWAHLIEDGEADCARWVHVGMEEVGLELAL